VTIALPSGLETEGWRTELKVCYIPARPMLGITARRRIVVGVLLTIGILAHADGVFAQDRWTVGDCDQKQLARLAKANLELGARLWKCLTQKNQSKSFAMLLRHTGTPTRSHLLLLVHGWRGGLFGTWKVLPEIFFNQGKHPDAPPWAANVDVLTYGYETGIWKGGNLTSEADRLAALISDITKPGVIEPAYSRIIIVAHSMGGLLVQRAILNVLSNPSAREAFAQRVGGAIYVAVPNELALADTSRGPRWQKWAIETFPKGEHTEALAAYSTFRNNLEEAWFTLVKNDPKTYQELILWRSALIKADNDDYVDPLTMDARFKDGSERAVEMRSCDQDHSGAAAVTGAGHSTFIHLTHFIPVFAPAVNDLRHPRLELYPRAGLYLGSTTTRYFLVHNGQPRSPELQFVVEPGTKVVNASGKAQPLIPEEIELRTSSVGDPPTSLFVRSRHDGSRREILVTPQPRKEAKKLIVGCFRNPGNDPDLKDHNIVDKVRRKVSRWLTDARHQTEDIGQIDPCRWTTENLQVGFHADVIDGEITRDAPPGVPRSSYTVWMSVHTQGGNPSKDAKVPALEKFEEPEPFINKPLRDLLQLRDGRSTP
jgi:pimeloyl-ACP methyl ester carboxylesterase